MTRTEIVYRYSREHATHLETSATAMLNQRVGQPCKGGSAIILPEGAPRPPTPQRKFCDICLAELEMDLEWEKPVTISS